MSTMVVDTRVISKDNRPYLEIVLGDGTEHWTYDFSVEDLPTDERREWLAGVLKTLIGQFISNTEQRTRERIRNHLKDLLKEVGLGS